MERDDLKAVSEHTVQVPKLIPGSMFVLHNFCVCCFRLRIWQTATVSGVSFTELLFRMFLQVSAAFFHTGYQNDLFSSALSQVRFRRYTAAWSPPTFTHTVWLLRQMCPILDKAYNQKTNKRTVVVSPRQESKDKFGLDIVFDYPQSHLKTKSNSSGLKLCWNATSYLSKSRLPSIVK